jgi:hypothetical protein
LRRCEEEARSELDRRRGMELGRHRSPHIDCECHPMIRDVHSDFFD